MNLRQIRYFLALSEERNFTRAARRCAVSQPSLTKGIKTLENELGGPLFHRRPYIRLSELGEALLPHFRTIITALDNTPKVAAALGRRFPELVTSQSNGAAAVRTPPLPLPVDQYPPVATAGGRRP